jgi:hypothetical protein
LRDNFGEPWPFDPRVDTHAFELLGFAETSAGITRTQRENRDGWYEHARRHKSFILDAAMRIEHTRLPVVLGAGKSSKLPLDELAKRFARPRLAVVLGAGKVYDLPLEELARIFERVVLVDIDAEAMAASSAAAVRDAKLRARLELRPMDVTGVTGRIARGIEAALESPCPEAALTSLCRSYRLATAPRLVTEHADLLVSGMILSQLGLQPKLAAKRLFEQRFGTIAPDAEARWAAAWNELDLKLQRDHVNALCEDAELAVVTSDVVHHSGGESWSTAGAGGLDSLVPAHVQVLARSRWTWPRIRNELRTDVHALLLRRRPA